MSDERAKNPRTVLIADHIWDAISSMAAEMGTERDALVNQALYTFARLNGFLVPSDLMTLGVVPKASLTDSGRLRVAPPATPTLIADQGAIPRSEERVKQTAHLTAAGGIARRAPPQAAPTPPPAVANDALDEPTSADLPRVATGPGRELVLLNPEGVELERVVKDRFVIGRGKHCDLVINSGKVSREHAAIVREGQTWFIEDLGSSNGTWFDARRITRRQIHDGDEYYISSEKLSCAFR